MGGGVEMAGGERLTGTLRPGQGVVVAIGALGPLVVDQPLDGRALGRGGQDRAAEGTVCVVGRQPLDAPALPLPEGGTDVLGQRCLVALVGGAVLFEQAP